MLVGIRLGPFEHVDDCCARQRAGVVAPAAQRRAVRRRRRGDDGEPQLRPLPRLATRRRWQAGGIVVRRLQWRAARDPRARARLPRLSLPRPPSRLAIGAAAVQSRKVRRLAEDCAGRRHVPDRLLHRCRSSDHGRAVTRAHHARPLLLFGDGTNRTESLVCVERHDRRGHVRLPRDLERQGNASEQSATCDLGPAAHRRRTPRLLRGPGAEQLSIQQPEVRRDHAYARAVLRGRGRRRATQRDLARPRPADVRRGCGHRLRRSPVRRRPAG